MAGLGRTVSNLGKQAHLAAVATCASHARRGIKGQLLGVLAGRAPASDDDAGIVDGTARGTDKGLERAASPAGGGGQDLRYPRRRDRRSQSVRRAQDGRPGAGRRQPFRQAGVAGTKAARAMERLPAARARKAVGPVQRFAGTGRRRIDLVQAIRRARPRRRPHGAAAPVLPEAGDDQVPAFTSFAVPLYPCMRFHVPSLTRALEWAWRRRVTHIELATPGPMGLAGLLIAKLLRLPVTASYHVEVLGLVPTLGGNPVMARGIRRYLAWFYAQVDRVFVMSSRSRDMLIAARHRAGQAVGHADGRRPG